jgi:hypothetical protein
MGQFSVENAIYGEAKRALEENLSLLNPEKHKAARNMTIALTYIVRQLGKLRTDVDLLRVGHPAKMGAG